MRRSRARLRGFTLIELMIVVAIIGILASIAVPSYDALVCKSKQSEGKNVLLSIFVAQETYRAEFDKYAIDGTGVNALATIGVEVRGKRLLYAYTVGAGGGPNQYLAVASGIDYMDGDIMHGTHNKSVTNQFDRCVLGRAP